MTSIIQTTMTEGRRVLSEAHARLLEADGAFEKELGRAYGDNKNALLARYRYAHADQGVAQAAEAFRAASADYAAAWALFREERRNCP